jgi:hypothetical protein
MAPTSTRHPGGIYMYVPRGSSESQNDPTGFSAFSQKMNDNHKVFFVIQNDLRDIYIDHK